MIEFKNINKVFDNGVQALNDINLHVKSGELMTIIGPSGCGKTTTMRMVNRLIEPTEGTILINGDDIRVFCDVPYFFTNAEKNKR